MAPVPLVTYLENSRPVTTLHCPPYMKIWLFLIPNSTWWTAGTFIRNTSVPQMSSLSTVVFDQWKASQGWPKGFSLFPRTPNCVGISETRRESGLGCPCLHKRLVQLKPKNLNQNKNAIFNWRSPKTLTVYRLTILYFYWVFGNVSCQVTQSTTREGCSHLHPNLRVSDQPLNNWLNITQQLSLPPLSTSHMAIRDTSLASSLARQIFPTFKFLALYWSFGDCPRTFFHVCSLYSVQSAYAPVWTTGSKQQEHSSCSLPRTKNSCQDLPCPLH